MKPCPLCLNPGDTGDTDDLYTGMNGPTIALAGCGRCGLQVHVKVVGSTREDKQAARDEARRRWDWMVRPDSGCSLHQHSDIYYSLEHDNFYCGTCRHGMGQDFYLANIASKDRFPHVPK